jgi:hypothetical protein
MDTRKRKRFGQEGGTAVQARVARCAFPSLPVGEPRIEWEVRGGPGAGLHAREMGAGVLRIEFGRGARHRGERG